MKNKSKPNPAPPLLCWDIYSEYLMEKLRFPAVPKEEVKILKEKKRKRI
ncbi:MAG TPA: hypothetical protein VIH57_16900 [Bacteroidales bacterium]